MRVVTLDKVTIQFTFDVRVPTYAFSGLIVIPVTGEPFANTVKLQLPTAAYNLFELKILLSGIFTKRFANIVPELPESIELYVALFILGSCRESPKLFPVFCGNDVGFKELESILLSPRPLTFEA